MFSMKSRGTTATHLLHSHTLHCHHAHIFHCVCSAASYPSLIFIIHFSFIESVCLCLFAHNYSTILWVISSFLPFFKIIIACCLSCNMGVYTGMGWWLGLPFVWVGIILLWELTFHQRGLLCCVLYGKDCNGMPSFCTDPFTTQHGKSRPCLSRPPVCLVIVGHADDNLTLWQQESDCCVERTPWQNMHAHTHTHQNVLAMAIHCTHAWRTETRRTTFAILYMCFIKKPCHGCPRKNPARWTDLTWLDRPEMVGQGRKPQTASHCPITPASHTH